MTADPRDLARADLDAGYVDEDGWNEPRELDRGHADPNVILSTVAGMPGMHMPALDIDFPARLVPSSTEGHFHLFLDTVLTVDHYRNLLDALVDCGIVQGAWAGRLAIDGATVLRLPHVKKDVKP